MLVSYRMVAFALLIAVAIVGLSLYLKRNDRRYSPRLRQNVVELVDTTIEHVENAKHAHEPWIQLQEASAAHAAWSAAQLLTTPEDLPRLVDVDLVSLHRQVKDQWTLARQRFQSSHE